MPAMLGGYELIRRLATGGMAEVFLARREGGSTCVALKRILPHLSHRPDFVRMFLDEARLALELRHPHIVRVFDFGLDGDSYWLAMEHVDGADLGALLRRARKRGARIPEADAVALLRQACEGLDHAHEQGIVHRDVTPSNLLVSSDGVVKLADFGIAELESSQARLAQGKRAYMSPEQARSGPIDRRTDVYSLGVCAWELLSGRRRREPLQLQSSSLAAIVEAAVEPDPARRIPSARALGEALSAWLASRSKLDSASGARGWLTHLLGADAWHRELDFVVEPTIPLDPPRVTDVWR